MAKVTGVMRNSIVKKFIRKGDEIVSFNGRKFVDVLDYIYADSLEKGTIEITSQTHFYAIELDETSKLKVTHKNVMDGDIEAFIDEKAKVIGTNLLLIDTLNEEENILNRFTKLMKK